MIILDEACDDFVQMGFKKNSLNSFVTRYSLTVDKNKAKELEVDEGYYEIINCNNINILPLDKIEEFNDLLTFYLKKIIKSLGYKKTDKVIVCGIGNKDIACDSLGERVCKKVFASNAVLWSGLGKVCTFCPNVESQTGIETSNLVISVAKSVGAKLIVLIDSLMTNSALRLGRSFQFSTSGLTPAGAMGKQKTISEKTASIKCLSIGVPFMFNLKNYDDSLNHDIIVSTKDITEQVELCAEILANSLNSIFNPSLTKKEIQELKRQF